MAGQRIDIMDLKQLIQLKGKGCSNRHIARQLGVSRNTVNGYVWFFPEPKKTLFFRGVLRSLCMRLNPFATHSIPGGPTGHSQWGRWGGGKLINTKYLPILRNPPRLCFLVAWFLLGTALVNPFLWWQD